MEQAVVSGLASPQVVEWLLLSLAALAVPFSIAWGAGYLEKEEENEDVAT